MPHNTADAIYAHNIAMLNKYDCASLRAREVKLKDGANEKTLLKLEPRSTFLRSSYSAETAAAVRQTIVQTLAGLEQVLTLNNGASSSSLSAIPAGNDETKKLLIQVQRAISFSQQFLIDQSLAAATVAIPPLFQPYLQPITIAECKQLRPAQDIKDLFRSLEPLPEPFQDPVTRRYDLTKAGAHDEIKDGEITISRPSLEAACIFLETQLRRLLRLLCLYQCFKYFSEDEDKKNQVYQHNIPNPTEDGLAIQNIGHASTLIQVNSFNVLTDPAFSDLNTILYPAKTKPGLSSDELPKLDVIVISHNHRDHLDIPTLKKLVRHQPVVLVPKGDEALLRSLGFTTVREMTWNDEITLTKGDKSIVITATPANHWSNRGLFDKNKSLVNGYLINPHTAQSREASADMVYFAGDTAVMGEKRMRAIAAILRMQMLVHNVRKNIINLEPGGPNYRRSLMQSTHQSAIESLLTMFKLAKYIAEIDQHVDSTNPRSASEWLNNIGTVFMHHNKFELGPDRFNESLLIYKNLIKILTNNTDAKIEQQAHKKNADFIWQGANKLLRAYGEIYRSSNTPNAETLNEQQLRYGLIETLSNHVSFPLIGKISVVPYNMPILKI